MQKIASLLALVCLSTPPAGLDPEGLPGGVVEEVKIEQALRGKLVGGWP